MISPQEAETIKQILGHNYAKKILDHLTETHIVRESGEEYSRQDVYNVMGSLRENEPMEAAIIELAGKTKEKKQETMAKRQAILK